MNNRNKSNVICFGDPKQTALYFDEILPISYTIEKIGEIWDEKKYVQLFNSFLRNDRVLKSLFYQNVDVTIKRNVLFHLIRKTLEHSFDFLDIFCQTIEKHKIQPIWELQPFSGSRNEAKNIAERYADILEGEKDTKSITAHTMQYLSSIYLAENFEQKLYHHASKKNPTLRSFLTGFSDVWSSSIVLPSDSISLFDPHDDDLTISLLNIELVDTSKVSWDQLLEFRNDSISKCKLKNFLHFFKTNYAGKSRQYIEDDIGKRVYDYNNACNDWGFETVASTISNLLDSKSLHATIGASLFGACIGEPILTNGALISGATIEIGKIAIQIAKDKHAFHKLKRDHDLAYIIEAMEI
jgi:hypothetical protein